MRKSISIVLASGAMFSEWMVSSASGQINSPGDVTGLVIQYEGFYTQSSTSPPGPSSTHTCGAFMTFDNTVSGDVDFVEVIKPSAAILSTSGSGTFYSTGEFTYASRSSLMTNWPSGIYTFSVTDFNEDVWNFPLTQSSAGGVWPAAVPAFTAASYNGLQGMNPTQPRFVEVNSFTIAPPANGQRSGLSINQRFGTLLGPTVWSGITTVGTPTSTRTIPANALQPNTDYFATWQFTHRVSSSFPPPAVVEFTSITFGNLTRVAFRTGAAAPSCVADVDDGSGTGTPDGGVTIDDLIYYLGLFEAGNVGADVDDGSGTGTTDGGVTIDDLIYYLTRFEAGC